MKMWDGNSKEYKVGDTVEYVGIVYEVIKDHISQPGSMPEIATELFKVKL